MEVLGVVCGEQREQGETQGDRNVNHMLRNDWIWFHLETRVLASWAKWVFLSELGPCWCLSLCFSAGKRMFWVAATNLAEQRLTWRLCSYIWNLTSDLPSQEVVTNGCVLDWAGELLKVPVPWPYLRPVKSEYLGMRLEQHPSIVKAVRWLKGAARFESYRGDNLDFL